MMHDDLDDVGKAHLDHLTASAMGVRGPKVDVDKTQTVKLGRRPKPKRKWEWEIGEGGLNREIEVTVRLPAYMVAALRHDALRHEGGVDGELREAVRDWLIKHDLESIWYPRFRAAMVAEQIEAKQKLREAGLG
jgi:hypothetical protein